MVKKCTSLLMALVLIFVFTACGGTSNNQTNDADNQVVTNGGSTTSPGVQNNSDKQETDKNNTLKKAVVYFSATGTTEKVAKTIASESGADIFEIVPKEAYSSDDLGYNDENCRATIEMNDETSRPEIKNDLSSLSDYDVIYLGHPIWWGTAPRIIQTFLESNDLSNAKIYTFCTSGGSGIEQSLSFLQTNYPELNIISGKRFDEPSETDARDWINSLK